jgi:hypothetical protein
MPPNTPLSQLVLWVPSALAAGWERLTPAQQTAVMQDLTPWLTARLLPPPPPPPDNTLEWIKGLSVAELTAFVKDLERKFRLQADGGMP